MAAIQPRSTLQVLDPAISDAPDLEVLAFTELAVACCQYIRVQIAATSERGVHILLEVCLCAQNYRLWYVDSNSFKDIRVDFVPKPYMFIAQSCVQSLMSNPSSFSVTICLTAW